MILYFSGTGNSLYIAKKLAEILDERIISIAELVCKGQYDIPVRDGENIGFVYPVIACAPPDVVTDFLKKVTFNGYHNNYIYSVYNCAGSPEYTSRVFKEKAKKAGFHVSGFYGVLMPGNWITHNKHLPAEKVQQYLSECDGKIAQIAKSVQEKESNYTKEKHSFLLSYVVHKLAVLQKTEKFIFGDDCVRCGKCVEICSMEAIQFVGDKLVRDEKKCAYCLGCVNVCPTRALQVGNKSQGNPQYVNPHYNGKARKQE